MSENADVWDTAEKVGAALVLVDVWTLDGGSFF